MLRLSNIVLPALLAVALCLNTSCKKDEPAEEQEEQCPDCRQEPGQDSEPALARLVVLVVEQAALRKAVREHARAGGAGDKHR